MSELEISLHLSCLFPLIQNIQILFECHSHYQFDAIGPLLGCLSFYCIIF